MLKRSFILLLVLTLLTSMTSFAATSTDFRVLVYTYDEYATDELTVKFRVTDDQSLQNGFVAIFAGNPLEPGAISLLAEQITENSSDITMIRTFDITSIPAQSSKQIYVLALDASGNEKIATPFTIKANHWDKPVHRLTSPSLDTSNTCDITYTGTRPTIAPTISITDYTSNNFTCVMYFTKIGDTPTPLDTKSITGKTCTFNSINLGSYQNGFYELKTVVTDNQGNTITNTKNILLN